MPILSRCVRLSVVANGRLTHARVRRREKDATTRNIVSSEQRVSVSDYDETSRTCPGRENAVMAAERDGLNEARLADDGADADCTATPRCRHSTSPSSVSDYVVSESTSSSYSPRNEDSLTEDVDDAGPSEARDDVEPLATATTTSSTSVPLLEELVSSPCEVVTPVQVSSAADSLALPATAGDTEEESSFSKSFLQKLESFVSSVGQVIPATMPRAPLTEWMRRPVFASRSGVSASGGMPMAAKRPSPYAVSADIFSSPSEAASTRPLDLSARRTESPADVDTTQRRHASLTQHRPGDGGVEGRFVDLSEMQSNGVDSLACLERDFGEHSTILTQLGSSRDRQRQAAAALTTMTNRRSRNAVMLPGLTAVHSSPVVGVCPSKTVATPHAEDLHQPRSFVDRSRQLPATSDRTRVLNANKLDSRHPTMSAMAAAAALRCLQCGRTFRSLPELTLHMIQTAHYANLICAAAAFSANDDDDCVNVEARNSRQSSNDPYARRRGPLQLSPGKDVTEMTDAGSADRRYRSGIDVARRDYVDAAVSPARSLDDESVSSAGLTETESLRSPTSTGSPTSPSYENVGDDELALMSHLLRLQPLLSRTALDNWQAGTAVPYHVDWMAVGLAAAEERRRRLLIGQSLKTSPRQMDRSSAADSLPIDLRSQRTDGSRYRACYSRQMPGLTAAANIAAFSSRPSPAACVEKLLDDVRGYRKSLIAGVKRSSTSRWHNGKYRTKKHRTYGTSSSEMKYDVQQLNGDRSAVVDTMSGELCRRKSDDGIREVASGVKMSLPVNQEKRYSRQEETANGPRRRTSPRDVVVQPIVIDGGTSDSPELSVRGRDCDVPTAAGQDLRRPSVNKDQSEYAARFGKYYRLAQELSSKSD